VCDPFINLVPAFSKHGKVGAPPTGSPAISLGPIFSDNRLKIVVRFWGKNKDSPLLKHIEVTEACSSGLWNLDYQKMEVLQEEK